MVSSVGKLPWRDSDCDTHQRRRARHYVPEAFAFATMMALPVVMAFATKAGLLPQGRSCFQSVFSFPHPVDTCGLTSSGLAPVRRAV